MFCRHKSQSEIAAHKFFRFIKNFHFMHQEYIGEAKKYEKLQLHKPNLSWHSFNKFLVRLDQKPDSWQQRTLLFCTYLVDCIHKSTTLKTYISAIKAVLCNDDYYWDDGQVLLGSVTRACKLSNDVVKNRFPIQLSLLELLLFEINRFWGVCNYTLKLCSRLFYV